MLASSSSPVTAHHARLGNRRVAPMVAKLGRRHAVARMVVRVAPTSTEASPTDRADPSKWWNKGTSSNMRSVDSIQELVDELADAGDKLVIVEFYAPWCNACKALYPKLCKIMDENVDDIRFLKVCFEDNKEMCKTLGVRVLPYFKLYQGAQGKVDEFSCSISKLQRFKDAVASYNGGICSLETMSPLDEFPDYLGLVTAVRLTNNGLAPTVLSDLLDTLDGLACSLTALQLMRDHISGVIPNRIEDFGKLATLSLAANQVSGPIPSTLGNLPDLTVLDLSNNRLEGKVPSELCRMGNNSKLAMLNLYNNRLNGSYDVPFCTSMVTLNIQSNSFTELGDMSSYHSLHILLWVNNTIKSPLPPSLSESVLMVDWLGDEAGRRSGTGLTGSLPDYVSQMTAIGAFQLAGNQLTGTLPPGLFRNLASLIAFSINDNKFTGTIPPEINLSPMTVLYFQSNSLHGRIPEEMAQFGQPGFSVYLENNHLFCCGTSLNGSGGSGWNGSEGLMSYEAIDETAPICLLFVVCEQHVAEAVLAAFRAHQPHSASCADSPRSSDDNYAAPAFMATDAAASPAAPGAAAAGNSGACGRSLMDHIRGDSLGASLDMDGQVLMMPPTRRSPPHVPFLLHAHTSALSAVSEGSRQTSVMASGTNGGDGTDDDGAPTATARSGASLALRSDIHTGAYYAPTERPRERVVSVFGDEEDEGEWAHQHFTFDTEPLVREVRAYRTGVFKFKASPEEVNMVHLTFAGLEARRLPSEPSKGKGNRVREASGLVCSAFAQLPDAAHAYAERHHEACEAAAGGAQGGGDGGMGSGLSQGAHGAGGLQGVVGGLRRAVVNLAASPARAAAAGTGAGNGAGGGAAAGAGGGGSGGGGAGSRLPGSPPAAAAAAGSFSQLPAAGR
ncbi:hypothetical protein FOA52_001888 [Chlamydomonas sp. UWO 241]|nr:hypothetical protein FOA52_001888 [Chlamydomonas sp. UWO 241]